MGEIEIKRVYDETSDADGRRVLVDRLWPRGVSKDAAALDEWAKDVAPSDQLRTWWDHDPERMEEFARRYRAELDQSKAARDLVDRARDASRMTLLFAAKDPEVSHAIVLRGWMRQRHG